MSLSSAQLALLRSESQYSQLYLGILQPATVLACQVNEYFGVDNDMILQFDYDNVTSGVYTDVVVGQVVYVGTEAGAYDAGICRVRDIDATTLYVGETSEIDFQDDLFITIVDAFELSPRHLTVDEDDAFYMDGDIAYDDQHENFDPVPIMGGHVVIDVDSYPAVINFPDIANSWVFDDTIASYLFESTDGVVTDETTTNPTLTISSYPTNGYIRVALTVTTTSGGKSFTGYRYVLVYDSDHRPIGDFTLDNCIAEADSGGWYCSVTLNDDSDIVTLRHRGLAILFAKDYFDGAQDVVGLHVGRENILMSGWIYQYRDIEDPEFSPMSFDIQSANFWLARMSAFPVGVELNATASWTGIPGLTVDKGIWHLLHWRSTVTMVMDVYLTDNTLYTASVESAGNSLWAQLQDIAQAQLLAECVCDYNNRLFVKVPYNLTPAADRAAASTLVIDLLDEDFEKGAEIGWAAPNVSKVFLSGVIVSAGGTGSPLFSLSPGHTPGRLGDIFVVDNMLLESQSQSNSLAGLVYSDKNNPYPDIPLTMLGNNRAFDIAPILYGTVSLYEYDGVILPRSIEYTYENNRLRVDIGFKGVTTEKISTDGDVPVGDGTYLTPGLGAFPSLPKFDFTVPDLPPLDFPGLGDPGVDTPCESYISNMFILSWSRTTLDGDNPNALEAHAYFPCKIRASGSFAPTYIKINGIWGGDAKDNYHVYGTLGGDRILTANVTHNANGNTATFSPVSDTQVDGIDIVISSGIGSIVSYLPGNVISSGSANATNASGVSIGGLTIGDYYAIDGAGGPFDVGGVGSQSYNFDLALTGAGFSGNVGRMIITGGGGSDDFYLTLPSGGAFVEAINNYYGRVYWKATLSSISFRCWDYNTPSFYPDNSGSLGYILRNASVYGRAIYLKQTTIYNVCAI